MESLCEYQPSCYLPAFKISRVYSHAPSIRSHRGTEVVWPDFQPMRIPEEPVYIDLFRQNPVFTSLHLKSTIHVVPPPFMLYRLRSIYRVAARGGHRHLQKGWMLEIEIILISEPPPAPPLPPPPPDVCIQSVGICVARRGRKPFIASWGLRMSHICPCTPCPPPPRV